MLKTPILFLIFNRPDTTERVFNEIKKQKPKYLFIAADGPRKNKKGEDEICEQTRKLVIENIDWNCEIKTLFRDHNLGCGIAVSEAITWFFKNVEEGIILEDDCLPNSSFFEYCSYFLNLYRHNKEIMHIGSHSLGIDKSDSNNIFFSAYNHIWGWATWKDAWSKYKFELNSNDIKIINKNIEIIFNSKSEKEFWRKKILNFKKENTWDYQWTFAIWKYKGKSILPMNNLVRNIGFDIHATHTSVRDPLINNSKYSNIDISRWTLFNEQQSINHNLDSQMSSRFFKINSIKSPITGSDNVLQIGSVVIDKIKQDYQTLYDIDINEYLNEISRVEIFQCQDTGYKFYYPFNISGNDKFYEQLQNFNWYYMPWKWEHEITSKYILPNFKILEVGCAEGDFMKRIKDSLKVEVTGLELNQKAISLARQNNLNVLPQLIQEHSREFIDYYDVVCSFQVLEHISDVHSFIDNKIKCLKKGGKLIVAVPNNDSFIQFDLENILNLPPHHMGLWNKKSLVNLTKIFPLSVEKIYLEPIQTYHLEWFHKVTHQRNYRLSQKKFIKLIMNKLPIFLKWRFEKLLFKFTKLLMPKFGHTILIVYNKK